VRLAEGAGADAAAGGARLAEGPGADAPGFDIDSSASRLPEAIGWVTAPGRGERMAEGAGDDAAATGALGGRTTGAATSATEACAAALGCECGWVGMPYGEGASAAAGSTAAGRTPGMSTAEG
jgi:hypothetical protein